MRWLSAFLIEIHREVGVSTGFSSEMAEYTPDAFDGTVNVIGGCRVKAVDFHFARGVDYFVVAQGHAYMVDVAGLWVGEEYEVTTLDIGQIGEIHLYTCSGLLAAVAR